MDVISFNEVSRVRLSVNRDSERIYGYEALSDIVAKYTRLRSSLKTGLARPGHINIRLPQLSLQSTLVKFLCTILVHCFSRMMRCISEAYAVMQCLSVCLSVCVFVMFVSCVKKRYLRNFFNIR